MWSAGKGVEDGRKTCGPVVSGAAGQDVRTRGNKNYGKDESGEGVCYIEAS